MLTIILGVTVFVTVIVALVLVLMFAKTKLVPSAEVSITINDDPDKAIVTPSGNTHLNTLAMHQIYIPSACGGKGTCGVCKAEVLEGGGALRAGELGDGGHETGIIVVDEDCMLLGTVLITKSEAFPRLHGRREGLHFTLRDHEFRHFDVLHALNLVVATTHGTRGRFFAASPHNLHTVDHSGSVAKAAIGARTGHRSGRPSMRLRRTPCPSL